MNARLRSTISKIAFPAAALILLVLIWQLVCSVGNVPKYMLPNVYRRVDHMPLTKNGKTDRRALREIYENT